MLVSETRWQYVVKGRSFSQQLIVPQFNKPKDIVSWMGAVQAQDFKMAKWAIGVRSNSQTTIAINEALSQGDILRMHIMRPTWHFVAAEDIHWMLKLTSPRLERIIESWGKQFGMTQGLYIKYIDLISKILAGGESLNKQEIQKKFSELGIPITIRHITCALIYAEAKGIICNGPYIENKHTYALLDERVLSAKNLSQDEALAQLALRYFRSHSPAELQDFVWWSGLSVTESKQAVWLIESELIKEQIDAKIFYTRRSCLQNENTEDIVHLLPSYDEYLIGYKNRSYVLDENFHYKAFTNYGHFYPIIIYNGRIVGNWSTVNDKSKLRVKISIFDKNYHINKELLQKAIDDYKSFVMQGTN